MPSDKYLIKTIHRVQNIVMWSNYIHEKHQLAKKNDGDYNERVLFHGTGSVDPAKVYAGTSGCGFDSRMGSAGSFYGAGAYFAEKASYSDQDEYVHTTSDGDRQLFLAKVLTGKSKDFGQSLSNGLKRPPPLPSGQGLYDSVKGGPHSGSVMYVVYDHKRSYPSYLITYGSPAKKRARRISGRHGRSGAKIVRRRRRPRRARRARKRRGQTFSKRGSISKAFRALFNGSDDDDDAADDDDDAAAYTAHLKWKWNGHIDDDDDDDDQEVNDGDRVLARYQGKWYKGTLLALAPTCGIVRFDDDSQVRKCKLSDIKKLLDDDDNDDDEEEKEVDDEDTRKARVMPTRPQRPVRPDPRVIPTRPGRRAMVLRRGPRTAGRSNSVRIGYDRSSLRRVNLRSTPENVQIKSSSHPLRPQPRPLVNPLKKQNRAKIRHSRLE